MNPTINDLNANWQTRLFDFVRRSDQRQELKQWCSSQSISYSSARNYLTKANCNEAIAELSKLSNSADDDQGKISDCSIRDLLSHLAVSKSLKKTDNSLSQYVDTLPEEEKRILEQLYSSGLSLKAEIALTRLQIYRAKKLQSMQDAKLAEGNSIDALTLKERKTGSIKAGDGLPTDKLKFVLHDWDKVIHRLMQLLLSLMSLQIKIQLGERLTADERADLISRITLQLESEKITAMQAAMRLSSAGITNIPLPIDLQMREELSQTGDVLGERVSNPQARIDEEIALRKAERDKTTDAFLLVREAELKESNQDD